MDATLNLEELPFDAESGRATGPPRELTRGNNHVGFFDPSPDGTAVAFGEKRGDIPTSGASIRLRLRFS